MCRIFLHMASYMYNFIFTGEGMCRVLFTHVEVGVEFYLHK